MNSLSAVEWEIVLDVLSMDRFDMSSVSSLVSAAAEDMMVADGVVTRDEVAVSFADGCTNATLALRSDVSRQ